MLLRCRNKQQVELPSGRVVSLAALADALAAELHVSDELTVLLPPDVCSICSQDVPNAERRLLDKTLPWRLEEALPLPIDSVHCAHGDSQEGAVAITITDRDFLQQLREQCAAAGLRCTQAYAALALVPWQSGQWTLWAEKDDTVWIRHGWHDGLVCSTGNLGDVLSQLRDAQQHWPAQIVAYADGDQWQRWQTALPVDLQSLLLLRKAPPWADLLRAAGPRCNVLQGAFAPPLPWRQWWREWRVAAALLAALLVGDAGLTFWQNLRLQQEQQRVEQQLVSWYRRVEPEGAIVDPLLQIRSLLASSTQAQLLPLLTRLAPALVSEPATYVESVEFDAQTGAIQLQVRSPAFTDIETLRGKLQALGLQVQLLGSNSAGDGSRASLRVSAS